MLKIAIVGTSRLNREFDEQNIRKLIALILKGYPPDILVISGGAVGVDSLAISVANNLGLKTKVYEPDMCSWTYFKKRNIKIAEDCDIMYCISTPVYKQPCYHHDELEDHEKTAGCWTMNYAKNLNKKTFFYKI